MLMTNEGTPDMHKNIFKENKPKMAYSRDAFIRDQQETRERQDQSETSVRLERDQRDMEIWRMAYHSLTRQLERAREIWRYGGWPIID